MSSDDLSETLATGATLAPAGLAPARPAPARWERACLLADLFPERGSAALFGDVQVALFLLPDGQVHAVQNLDPFSGAHVMSRGIVGTRAGEPTVAAPVYKQVFSLVTGECLAAADKVPQGTLSPNLTTYEVKIRADTIYVALP